MAKEVKDHTFSLVEYLMIVMIVGIIVVFAVPLTQANEVQPKIREMKDNVNSVLKAFDEVYAIDTLKVNKVVAFNNQDLKYTIKVNNFLKYVNFEKKFAKNYLNIMKKKHFINFYKNEVRPLVKVAYLQKYDQYVNNLSNISLKFDYDRLPNVGSFLQEDKFFAYYDLAEANLARFVSPGLEDKFNEEIIGTIDFVKQLKSQNDVYVLDYNQIKKFSDINLIDIDQVEDKYFSYRLNPDSTIVATSTEEFGTAGAQIIYSIQEELYSVGPKKEFDKLGVNFLNRSIETLDTKVSDRDKAVSEFKAIVNPENYDLETTLMTQDQKDFLVNFETYVKSNFNLNEVDTYLDFYNHYNKLIGVYANSNKNRLVATIDKHDGMKKPSAKIKGEINQKVADWEKMNALKASIDAKIKSLNKVVKASEAVTKVEDHKELKENYFKSYNTIDFDWLILE